MQSLLETARATALAEGDLIRVALEHQMIENDRTLIASMIESFRKQAAVERLVLLDRSGTERYPAGNGAPDADLQINSPTCQACHRYPPEQRGSSRVIETRGGTGAAHRGPDPQPRGVLRLPRPEPQDQRHPDSGLPDRSIAAKP